MKYFIFICLFFCSCAQDTLHGFCPNKCWAVPGVSKGVTEKNYYYYTREGKPKVGIGECKYGIPVCDENFNIIECKDEVLPTEEICNFKDDDCDFVVDEGPFLDEPLVKYSFENDCLKLGVCRDSIAVCINGEYICQYPSTYEKDKEISCDNLNNDCDYETDEDLFQNEFCYDVDSSLWYTVTNPPCHPGIYSCINGRKECINATYPKTEICDFIDNNCDGFIDNTGNSLELKYDFVFIVDNSGSMQNEINAVAYALNQYTDLYMNNPNIRFALVCMSYSEVETVKTLADFGDLIVLQNALANLGFTGYSGENGIGALKRVCGRDNSLGLSWDENAVVKVFMFTDENPQSYDIPPDRLDDINCYGTETNIWSDFGEGWELYPDHWYPISENWRQMYDNFEEIRLEGCVD